MLTAKQTLTENYEYICKLDPAVDSDADGFKQAWAEYLDGGEPPLRPGSSPTIFTLRQLRGSANIKLQDSIRRTATAEDGVGLESIALAFRLGVVSAEPWHDPSGQRLEVGHERSGGLVMVDEATLSMFPPPVIVDVGLRVLGRTFPDPKS